MSADFGRIVTSHDAEGQVVIASAAGRFSSLTLAILASGGQWPMLSKAL